MSSKEKERLKSPKNFKKNAGILFGKILCVTKIVTD